MAFSLTIDGYTFDNPPSNYRKRVELGNSPQPHYRKTSTPFYRSDSQQITLEVSGRLNLNDQGDLDELEKLQDKAIQGGEVDVQFDPFFSGTGVIEDDPFEQENQVGTYEFTIAINEETTDDSAYPAHATPTTGNTFELGSFDFGFDPDTVSQEYDRQTERVDRLQGVAHTADTEGLVTRVSLDGRVDGGGQSVLWEKARSNALAYLSAEFQNGWALLQSLSVQKDDATPDYLQGLFAYSAEFLIVKDPASGIGEVSQFIDHDVGDSGTYTSDGDSGSGSDEGGLDFKVRGGTGSIDGEYVDWVVTTITLSDNATNYVFVEDPDGDGQGDVVFNTSGFPSSGALPLYEVDTQNGDIVDVRDVRDSLLGSDDDTTSDLLFRDEFSIDDTGFSFAEILAFADAVGDPAVAKSYLGLASLSESIADPVEGPLDALGLATMTETITFDDGGSAFGGGGGTTETKSYSGPTDWNNSASEVGVVHESFGDRTDAEIQLGYPSTWWDGRSLTLYYPLDDDSPGGTATDVSGNNNDGTNNGITPGATGLHGTTGYQFNSPENDYVQLPSGVISTGSDWTILLGLKPTSTDLSSATRYLTMRDDLNFYFYTGEDNPSDEFGIRWDTTYFNTGTQLTADTWYLMGAAYDSSAPGLDGYLQANQELDINQGTQGDSWNNLLGQETQKEGSSVFDGVVDFLIIAPWYMSQSEITEVYDAWNPSASPNGTLTSGTKSYSSSADPSSIVLENVSATLNSQAIDVVVETDPDTDGNFEETSDPVSLDGSGGPYSVTGLSSTFTDFRVRVELSTSNPEATPTISSLDVSATGGGGDSDQNPNTTWTMRGIKPDTSGHEYEGGGFVGYPAGD